MIKNICISIIIGIALLGCAAPAQPTEVRMKPVPPSTASITDIPLPTETSTLLPTFTPLPTSTPLPTLTDIPTITMTPTIEPPSPLKDALSDVKIKSIARFDSSYEKADWWMEGPVTFSDTIRVTGKEFWQSGIGKRNSNYQTGSGVMFKYKFMKGTEAEYYFGTGTWNTTGYKRFGVYQAGINPSINIFEGKNWMKGGGNYLNGNLKSKPDEWLQAAIAIGKKGTFTAIIWDPADPTQIKKITRSFGEKWDNQNWIFSFGANKGEIDVDDFCEFTFGEIIK